MGKWKVFKERLHPSWKPMWVVWDNYYGEYLFRSGQEALTFVHQEITQRQLSARLRQRQEQICNGR